MSGSQSVIAAALADLTAWVEAGLRPVPAGAAFRALLPRSPFQLNVAETEPADLPVLRFWPAALPDGADPVAGAAAQALRVLSPALRWRQNPTYRNPAFLAGYGYTEIAGPAGLVAAPGLSLGILLLAPAMLYPAHRHPAEEIYLPLQPALWQHGDAGLWRRQPSGAVIHHPSMLVHAMRTDAAALPALYLWRGDLATPAAFSPSP
jgi:hypothetical protein